MPGGIQTSGDKYQLVLKDAEHSVSSTKTKFLHGANILAAIANNDYC